MAHLPHIPSWLICILFGLTIVGVHIHSGFGELFGLVLKDGIIALELVIFHNLGMKALSIWEKKITAK